MGRALDVMRSKAFRFVVAGVVLIAAVVVGIEVTKGSATYRLKAVYSSAPGLFPGAAVDVLGVPVGTVTAVTNVADHVDVVMQVKTSTKIPTSVEASLVAPQVLGQPNVDLNPGYTGGPHLPAGATIPLSRTSIPVSTDQLLKELQRTLKALNPQAVGSLITNLSQDLDGQGAALNQLIQSAAGTIQLLANKGNDLGQLDGTLAQLTGTLDSDTAQIEQLVKEYDTVSTVLAQRAGPLNDAITQLTGATTSLVTLLTPNLAPLEADVGTVTTAGRTLDRNLSNVDEILTQANNLFQGAKRAFDPTYNWLNLNAALPVGVTGSYIAGLVRDRLAGICRRLTANHAAGLSAATLATLTSCGNVNSGFFDPLINEIPTILNTLTGGSASSSVTSLLQTGLNLIGGIGAPSGATSGGVSSVTESGTTSTPVTAPPASSTTTTTAPTTLCNVLQAVLGCTPTTGAGAKSTPKATPSKSTTTTTSGGLGGLLSQTDAATPSAAPVASLAASKSAAPSLNAPAARLLPALGSHHRTHAVHRGLVAQWAHDLGSWL